MEMSSSVVSLLTAARVLSDCSSAIPSATERSLTAKDREVSFVIRKGCFHQKDWTMTHSERNDSEMLSTDRMKSTNTFLGSPRCVYFWKISKTYKGYSMYSI